MTIALDSQKHLSSFDMYKKGITYNSSIVQPSYAQYRKAHLVSNNARTSRKFSFARKIVIAILVVMTFVVVTLPATKAFGGFSLVPAERPSADLKGKKISIVVQEGDTLWSIARKIDPEKDPRSIVDQFVAARGTSNVYAGETIEWTL